MTNEGQREGDSSGGELGNDRALHDQRAAHYEAHWSRLRDEMAPAFAAGLPLDQLLARHEVLNDSRYQGFIAPQIARYLGRLDQRAFAGVAAPDRLVVAEGRYQARPRADQFAVLSAAVSGLADRQVDCIVEFGAGLGVNLGRLAQVLAPLGIHPTYVACEPAAGGRDFAARLFAGGEHRFEAHEFDYLAPEFGFLGRFRRILAFTCHSIEQVSVLGPAFHDGLLRLPLAGGLHLEPVGWQRFTNIAAAVAEAHRSNQALQWYRREYEYVLEDDRVVENAAAWAAASLYNTDLLAQVGRLADAGRIGLAALAFEIVGENPFNPSTLIAWRPGG
ncbi:MAG: hypothetical protein ACT7A5_32310 [Ferrovibrionaceae bacterium]